MLRGNWKGKTYQRINDDTRAAQVEFQRQVQEWKNILLEEMTQSFMKIFKTI